MATLILLRHGQSTWNLENLFTGWVDVGLTERERGGARRRARAEHDVLPDVAAHVAAGPRDPHRGARRCGACDRTWIPVRRSWRLNERHYGDVAGSEQEGDRRAVRRGDAAGVAPLLRRAAAAARVGRVRPTRATADLRPSWFPQSECLDGRRRADGAVVVRRDRPGPRSAGRVTLVAAHGNSLRALEMHLEGLTPDEILKVNIGTGQPLVYELDERTRREVVDGYIDPEAAAAAADAVAKHRLSDVASLRTQCRS